MFLQRRYANGKQACEKMFNCQRNANQTHSELPVHTHQDGYNQKVRLKKKDNNTSVDEDMKKNPHTLAGGNVK